MSLSETPYPNDLFTESSTPPFANHYTISSTPLILPRDWPDSYYYPDPDYDFQSNHLETAELDSDVVPSLAGLGIKNIDLCDANNDYGDDELHYPEFLERRNHQRAYRTESIYDVERNLDDGECFDTLGSSSESPWTLATCLKVAELDLNILAEEMVATEPDLEMEFSEAFAAQVSESAEDNLAQSFEKLSAATGLSVAEFAAQISASAAATLKRMAETDSSGRPALRSEADIENTEAVNREVSNWPPIATRTPELPLPLVDINMRISESTWNSGCVGVNLADILPMSPQSGGKDISENSFSTNQVQEPYQTGQQLNMPDFHFGLHYSILAPEVPSPSHERYVSLPLPPLATNNAQDGNNASDDDRSVFQSPSCSEYSPPPPPSTGTKRTQSSRISTRRIINEDVDPSYDFPDDIDQQNLPPINLGTPVFDAHRGIVLDELKAKAERYRLRNQGRDYDKRWLISFAGKLTDRGELLEEFRCYVSGCKQTNKRRDHILIHVGAHLDQRPFKCMHCSSRFLRKNECKRHELSHTGVRPFSCHICPSPATTFVRQDLLKRHMKRTHRIDFKIEKENEYDEPPRPKKRAKH